MSARRRPVRPRREDGYTMIELIAVLAIFLTVVTSLTTLFVSGAKAELDASRRFEAQQNARIALDQLRRELHCSNGVTKTDGTPLGPTPVAAILVSLPSHCPASRGVATTVTFQTVSLGTGRWQLQRIQDTVTKPLADYVTNDDVFTYTAQSTASRALLRVDMPVNVNPNEGWKQWRLVDDIVLRNTVRADP